MVPVNSEQNKKIRATAKGGRSFLFLSRKEIEGVTKVIVDTVVLTIKKLGL